MDKRFLELMDSTTPKINPRIANGLAVEHLPRAAQYINEVWKNVEDSFIPGLEYKGLEICTPDEEYRVVSRFSADKTKSVPRTYECSRSDVFLIKVSLSYKGEDLVKYMYLPFCEDAGVMYLRGSRFVIFPVLADTVISVNVQDIFTRFFRDKFITKRLQHSIFVDDKMETSQVAWSLIYHKHKSLDRLRPVVKAKSTLVHYMLCRFGMTEMLKKFAGVSDVKIYNSESEEAKNIDHENWVECKSLGTRPTTLSRYEVYKPCPLCIAIKRDEWNQISKTYLTAIFYILDHFPQRVRPQDVDSTRLWTILMGHLLFSSEISEGKLFIDTNVHLNSLADYIDDLSRKEIEQIGYKVDDVFGFFGILVNNIDEWLMNARERVSSMYNKKFMILYFLLFPFISNIFNFHFKVKAQARKKSANGKELTIKEIQNAMNTWLRIDTVYTITNKPVCTTTESYPGDNKFFKFTCMMAPQNTSSDSKTNEIGAMSNPSNFFHPSICEVANYATMTKSAPTGSGRINPHLHLDAHSAVVPNPALAEIQKEVLKKTTRF